MGNIYGTHENEEGLRTVFWWGKLMERRYMGGVGIALVVSYEGKFRSHAF
jgi:hypothetical protein